jgi:pyruvate dehydrogenase E2 component (dihydrolipoamide acetyltransferase)
MRDQQMKADQPAAEQGAVERQPLSMLRRRIAQQMTKSTDEAPQLTLHTEADVTAMVERREALKECAGITYTDILVKVVADVLTRHPQLNANWDGDAIMVHKDVNVGVAVALEEGLIVPVVRNADEKSLEEISSAVTDVVDRARERKLLIQDVSGGTFTVTNLGRSCVDFFTPILNPPQAAILGVGRITRRPAVVNEEIAIRSTMGLSLTFDHRVVDGVPGAAFLDEITRILAAADF